MYAPTNPITEEIRAQRLVSSLTDREAFADIFSPMSAPPTPARRTPRIARTMNLVQSIMRNFKASQHRSRAASPGLKRLDPNCDPC